MNTDDGLYSIRNGKFKFWNLPVDDGKTGQGQW